MNPLPLKSLGLVFFLIECVFLFLFIFLKDSCAYYHCIYLSMLKIKYRKYYYEILLQL